MRWMLLLLLLVCAAALAWADGDVPYYRTSHALLIGINQYRHVPPLSYAVNDVTALRAVLVQSYGFPEAHITTLTDGQATKQAISAALAAVTSAKTLTADDRVLIFYSGHGQTVKMPVGGEKGFLIPVDARVSLTAPDPADYMNTCISMSQVWDALDLCPARHVLLIADACYSGLLAKSKALDAKPDVSVRILAARPARQILTAGRAGEKATENAEWGHGALTYKLLSELKARATVPGETLTTRELHATLFRQVTNLTGGRQTPVLADKDTDGEFLFIPTGTAPRPPAPVPPSTGGTVTPKDVRARLQVTSTPAGALVKVDGVAQEARTPCTLPVDLAGKETRALVVDVLLAGYESQCFDVTLDRGKLTPLALTLRKRPEAPVAPSVPTTPTVGQTKTNPKDGAELVLIPAGEFLMGSTDADKSAGSDEKPQHTVYLDAYSIYKTEVTVAQYRTFCTATNRTMPPEPDWKWQDTHPVVNVTWDDAQAYAAWAGASLPTEAQWEKAARGGDGRPYPWGQTWDAGKCSNSVGNNNPGKTSPVGSYPAGASPYGCLDMAGNVWEWCADWYGSYTNAPAKNPTGPTTGTARVLRGGSWYNKHPAYLRAAYRFSYSRPTGRYGILGLRCVVRLPGP
jgi:formylglycine-generating enzyme required for sulfatase activity/uncharacterized caspase-like protein